MCKIGAMIALLSLGAAPAPASEPVAHTVTAQASPITEIAISGGDVSLVVEMLAPQTDPTPVANAGAGLRWTVNVTSKRISVASDKPDSCFGLMVEATDVTGGTPAGPVVLSGRGRASEARTVVENVSRTTGFCTLTYTAWLERPRSPGTETQVVAYTITDQ